MKFRKLLTTGFALLPSLFIIASSLPASAVTVNYHNLISDPIFDNVNTMNAGQIDAFLNAFPNSCISSSHGFKSQDPIGYNPSQGYLYGSNVTAGKVIYDAAQAYDINPQVLLATTQKEESLVTGAGGCSTFGYATAMGYGCPDSGGGHNYSGVNLYTLNGHTVTSVTGTCVNSIQKVGFTRQIIHAAWLLKFDRMRSEGKVTWAIVNGNWDNTDDLSTCYAGRMTQGNFQRCPSGPSQPYDGLSTIDGTSTHIDDGATASLYEYTPHFSGNNHFVTIFTQWFGSTQYAFAGEATVQVWSDAAHTQALDLTQNVLSSKKIYVTVSALNSGSKIWSNTYTRIATIIPTNRCSIFRDSSWLSCNRAASLMQGSVAPNATGTFQFSMTAPNTDGDYPENFRLVADGQNSGWMQDSSSFGLMIHVHNPYNASSLSVRAFTDPEHHRQLYSPDLALYRNQKIYMIISAKNIGSQSWSQSFLHIAATNPANRVSPFADNSWFATDRSASMLEPTVAPNNTATFVYSMTAPNVDGNYNENFGMVADGQTNGWMPYPWFYRNINVSAQPSNQLQPGQRLNLGGSLASTDGRYKLVMLWDGNLVLFSQNRALWASGTNDKEASTVIMQGDGNLVIYAHSGKVLWQSHTARHGNAALNLQTDGNLVIYSGSTRAVWSSKTSGKW